jgi:hypothetical protein
MAKKWVFVLLMALTSLVNVFSGEWDNIFAVTLRFMTSNTDKQFFLSEKMSVAVRQECLKNGATKVNKMVKIPIEITQRINYELKSYDLDVGDMFSFDCARMFGNSAVFLIVIIRIATVSNGKCTWDYHALQYLH